MVPFGCKRNGKQDKERHTKGGWSRVKRDMKARGTVWVLKLVQDDGAADGTDVRLTANLKMVADVRVAILPVGIRFLVRIKNVLRVKNRLNFAE